ncbi:DUF2815 family protein (plasmid) [Candidatus Liberibacter asiaticus]|uniref:Phage-related protein n=1 Tax=Liberibacter asiaticus TaxID=34021 RepID=C6L1S9_LIBAS|nr:ssDNA-binding protein [Candidatus Liberibacter asiaticus]APD21508.1 hypothetical protein PHHCA_gp33 [Liberibacter phage HHCA1-2]ALK07732.1 DUF2815 family protein [Candidatus Liberibacter asiaticus]KAE9517057.1 hypothetical protein FXW24_05470 [Candidatus Liberibacter asiaticus]QNF77009.1 DUF2815 family protein [Candidatus Liberibacter asiaticus]UCZ51299.1 DUF2815 family protein [Candidatus Liberibacter asiaticus]
MQKLTVKGRLSYPALDTKVRMKLPDGSSVEHYGCDIVFPKTDTKQINAVEACLKTAVTEIFPNVSPDAFLSAVRSKSESRGVLRDGDAKIASSHKPENYTQTYTDSVYISAKNKYVQPLLVDRQAQPVSNPREVFYAGCWVIAKLNIGAYELDPYKTKGFSCTLTGVQFFKHDERWGASPKSDTSEFKDYGEEQDSDTSVSNFASAEVDSDALPWN